MKKCKYCGEIKPYSDYKKHVTTKDGYFHICRDCDNKYQKAYRDKKKNDPDWVENEKRRAKDKYYRLEYGKKWKINDWKFPEKRAAKNHSAHIKIDKGNVKHHWSYNEEHWKDIIQLTDANHRKAHRYLIYDQERMMFRTTDLILLDSKLSHIQYLDTVLQVIF